MFGDFNEILFSYEVSGGQFNASRACLLADMFANCNLLDLHTTGGLYTFRRNVQLAGHVRKKLDRVVADIDWHLAFPTARVEVISQHGSDHNPLHIKCSNAQGNIHKFFHFQAAWMSHPDYDSLVSNTWHNVGGDAIFKLGKIREKSIIFNKEVFGNIFKRKRQLEARIKGVHLELDHYPSSDLIRLEKDLQQQYSNVLREEELLWFQKSRENWVKFGNKNTKFYHTQTVIRRRRNKVTSLDIGGIICDDEEVLCREAHSFFKQLFQQTSHCDPHSLNIDCTSKIPQELYDLLLTPVSMDEVKDALFSMDPYKAPGPDGFQPIFFRSYWQVISTDVWELIAKAFHSGVVDDYLTETLIVPIPKVDDPKSLRDFRPISLCNVLLKLISKIIVRRMRPFLDDFIGPLQGSFIPNRGTTDNAMIAQELVHFMHKKKGKNGFLMFKIDFEKAYDSVDWNFLRITLSDFGFPPPIIRLIMSGVTSSNLAVKWNNRKLENFSPTRGLRQGDPLSPYLFLLCMEKLALMIQSKVDNHLWKPIKICEHGPEISHLFFADDCLLFTSAKSSQVRIVKEVLHSFCLASGMKINIQKSRFLPSKNLPRPKVLKFERILEFQHTYNIGRYLGFPMLSGRVTNSCFSFIIDKVNSRLAGWKGKLLSRAGRVTLAKSVLSSMPIYTMHNLWIPEGICDSLDSAIKQFVWGGKTCHWVKWGKTSTPMSRGGLGLRRTRPANIAMLGKHVWELIHNPNKLWVKLLTARYAPNSNIFLESVCPGASYTWQSMLKAAVVLRPGYIYRVGNGNISLWYEKWLHKGRLCDSVPYVDIHDIHLSVRDIYVDSRWNFDLLYTQIPLDVQLEIQSLFLNPNLLDIITWAPSPSGAYSPKSAYAWLIGTCGPSSLDQTANHIGGWSWIWKLRIPENLKHFVWLIMHMSLPTNWFRVYRHFTQDGSCHLCGADREDIIHLLRDCSIAQNVWKSLSFNTDAGEANDDTQRWFKHHAISDHGILFLCCCWSLWMARNDEVFNDAKWASWKILNRTKQLCNDAGQFLVAEVSTRPPRLVRWFPPTSNFIKLNVDGSSIGNPGRSGYGGLLRDHTGSWLLGFSGNCGIASNLNAELHAIAKGLDLAWSKGYRSIICESDSKTALSLISREIEATHPYASIISYIKSLSLKAWYLKFVHTLREGNSCADWFAKFGANMSYGEHVWPLCPAAVSPLLIADAMGIEHVRI